MKNRVLYIHQKRDDAIGIVNFEQISRLQKHEKNIFDFLEIRKKWTKKWEILKNYFLNFCILFYKSFGYKNLYFSYENPYILGLKIVFPWKKISMCVHHVEAWGESILGQMILASCDKIVAISYFTRHQIENLKNGDKNRKKIVVNYNGISEKFFPEKIENFREKPYILTVGTEAPRKNIATLLAVFEKFHALFPEIELVKIGDAGSPENEKMTEKIVKNLKCKKNIYFFREKMSADELRKYYSNAEFYITLSKLEGFGMTVPEALSCDCNVICSDIAPFREICENTWTLVPAENIETILAAMISEIKNPKKVVFTKKQQFNWDRNTEFLLQLF